MRPSRLHLGLRRCTHRQAANLTPPTATRRAHPVPKCSATWTVRLCLPRMSRRLVRTTLPSIRRSSSDLLHPSVANSPAMALSCMRRRRPTPPRRHREKARDRMAQPTPNHPLGSPKRVNRAAPKSVDAMDVSRSALYARCWARHARTITPVSSAAHPRAFAPAQRSRPEPS